MTFDEFNQRILDIEEKYGFDSVVIEGVPVWRYLRITMNAVYYQWSYQVYEGYGLTHMDMAHPLLNFLRSVKHGSFFHQFGRQALRGKKTDVLYFIPNSRHRVGDKDVNTYVDDFINSTPEELSYEVIEWAHYQSDDHGSNPAIDHLKYISHEKIIYRYVTREYDDEEGIERALREKIFTPIEKELQISISEDTIKKYVYETLFHIRYGETYRNYFQQILNEVQPGIVLFFNAEEPYNQILMDVCRARGILSAEIQHGTLGNSIWMRFCSRAISNLVYPEYYVAYGEISKYTISKETSDCPYGLSSDHIEPVGRRMLDDYLQKSVQRRHEVKNILIVGTPDEEYHQFVLDLVKKLRPDEYHIVYKLHPGFGLSASFSDELKMMGVIIRCDGDIYKMVLDSDYIVSYVSTVVLEAIYLQKRVIIYRGTNDQLSDVIERKLAIGVYTASECVEAVSHWDDSVIEQGNIGYYYQTEPVKKYQAFLRRVCVR